MQVRIYMKQTSATQSAPLSQKWHLKYQADPEQEFIEPFMGWKGSTDMSNEVNMVFDSLEAAEQFAIDNKLEYEIVQPKAKFLKAKSYSDNFK